MKSTTFFILTIFLTNCNNENKRSADRFTEIEKKPFDTEVYSDDFLKKINIIKMPFTDSTNFNNFKAINKLSQSEIDFLKLKKINGNATDFYVGYKPIFSHNFQSIVVTYKSGEHELFTTLINYNSKYEILDKIDIAYDEIAESVFRKISTLEINAIKIDEINFSEETPIHEKSNYIILDSGKFQIKK